MRRRELSRGQWAHWPVRFPLKPQPLTETHQLFPPQSLLLSRPVHHPAATAMSTAALRLISTRHLHPIDVDLAAARQEFLIASLVILQHAVLTPSELDTIVGGAAGRATTSISHVGAAYRVELQGGRYLDANAGDMYLPPPTPRQS